MKVAGRTIDLSWIYVYAVLFFLLSPLIAIVVLSISKTVYLQFPPELFSIQWYIALFKSEKLLRSLYLSVRVAVPATFLATFCGTLAALGARALGLRDTRFVGRRFETARGTAFRFLGSGWGHGVGLCQFGAVGMAQAGYTFEEILAHYYRGVTLRHLRELRLHQ